MSEKEAIKKARAIYNKLDPKTKVIPFRIGPKKLERIKASVQNDGFPSIAAWLDKATDHFLGDC
jgi:predicted DNA binding CopG/RHH family protein